jgi:hypothetical protein
VGDILKNMTQDRIRKGIQYFRGKSFDNFNRADYSFLLVFLDLVEKNINGLDAKTNVDRESGNSDEQIKIAQQVFDIPFDIPLDNHY